MPNSVVNFHRKTRLKVFQQSALSQTDSSWWAIGDKMQSVQKSADRTGRKTCATSAINTSLIFIWLHLCTGSLGITEIEVRTLREILRYIVDGEIMFCINWLGFFSHPFSLIYSFRRPFIHSLFRAFIYSFTWFRRDFSLHAHDFKFSSFCIFVK